MQIRKKYIRYRNAKSGVYVIKNLINKHFYLGSTVCDKRRWRTHRSDLRDNHHENIRLQRAWHKYGPDAFEFELICEVDAVTALQMEDRLLGKFFGKKYCYNLSRSALMPGLGRVWTPEMRQRQSEAQRGKRRTKEQIARMCGRKMSIETRENMSIAARNRKISPEMTKQWKANIAAGHRGVVFVESRKKNISLSKIGHSVSDETKEKLSQSVKLADCRKYKFSKEHINNALDMYNKGNWTQKHVANKFGISEAHFGRLIKKQNMEK